MPRTTHATGSTRTSTARARHARQAARSTASYSHWAKKSSAPWPPKPVRARMTWSRIAPASSPPATRRRVRCAKGSPTGAAAICARDRQGPTEFESGFRQSGGGRAGGRGLLRPHHLVAAETDADQRDRHAHEVPDVREVVARRLREVLQRAALGQVLGPAGQLLVLRLGRVKHRLVVGEVDEL